MSETANPDDTDNPNFTRDLVAALEASDGPSKASEVDTESEPTSSIPLSTHTNSGVEPSVESPKIFISVNTENHADTEFQSLTLEPAISISTEEDSVSTRERSESSVAGSIHSAASAIRATQRNYLSPLRSKRYDGLRSSLLSPSSFTRPTYFASNSRTSSVASLQQISDLSGTCTIDDLTETIKWTRLRKISDQLYSESGRKAFGRPTCFAIAGLLAIGTSKGILVIFDYQQTCRHILGTGSAAVQSGQISSIALSADHTFALTGHEDGSIYSWDLARPAKPSATIAPVSALTSGVSGHIRGTRISFVSFVGARHSAFVSADDTGFVFYHNFNRKLLFSSADTVRILGRHPESAHNMKLKPSAVYASTVLPLGNVSNFSDRSGLVAIMTPYKLVLISTVPLPRTQFRLSRASGAIASASSVSACAAWYPATKTNDGIDEPLLAFAWCRHLQFLHIREDLKAQHNESVQTTVPQITATLKGEFVCPDSIVMMQWFSRSILCILTSSSQFLVLDTVAMKITGQSDLASKQILHHDIYRERLKTYFELREAEYVNQTFADAYTGSFQTYKGKAFLLGSYDIYMGTFLTWADKLLTLLAAGQHVEAIEMLLQCYRGSVELDTLHLSRLPKQRQDKLAPKIYETMLSSIRFSLASEDLSIRSDSYHSRLLEACLQACLLLNDVHFFVNEIYDEYEEVGRTEPFLECLAVSILNDQVTDVPAIVVQSLVKHFVQQKLLTRLEDVICRLNPIVLDINSIIGLCEKHNLYNAMTFVLTEALHDFRSPLFEFFKLINTIFEKTQRSPGQSTDIEMLELGAITVNAVKVFPYISQTLSGQVFPSAKDRSIEYANYGRSQTFEVLFSGSYISWPADSHGLVLSGMEESSTNYPYLRLLLLFDCPTLLASMDEAFEDSFLNEAFELQSRSSAGALSITRQFIVNILLEVMDDGFVHEDKIYLYIFIARNVPKYPQFILLSGSVLQRIIIGLCHCNDNELTEDCQLSVEYLLSIYRPANSGDMLQHYRAAGFYRVLKTIYRADQNWPELLLAEIQDEASDHSVFNCIAELLSPDSTLGERQRIDVHKVILEHIVAITSLDGARAAEIIETYAPELQISIFEALTSRAGLLYIYLRQIMEMPSSHQWLTPVMRARFIDLLCVYDRDHLLGYLSTLKPGEVVLETIVDNLEQYDFIDAIVQLMSTQGNRHSALSKVILAIAASAKALQGQHDQALAAFAASRETFQKYTLIGAGLCEAETMQAPKHEQHGQAETMWVDLIDAVVESYTSFAAILQKQNHVKQGKKMRLLTQSQSVVQNLCSRLFVASYRKSATSTANILRSWFAQLQTEGRSLDLIIKMLYEVFGSYKYYHQLLALAQTVVGGQLFSEFAAQVVANSKGWVVETDSCCICSKSLRANTRHFRDLQMDVAQARAHRFSERQETIQRRHGLRHNPGKRPVHALDASQGRSHRDSGSEGNSTMRIISHACGHLSHEDCYQDLHVESESISCVKCRHENDYAANLGSNSEVRETLLDEHLVPATY